jgi:hypothetical protein
MTVRFRADLTDHQRHTALSVAGAFGVHAERVGVTGRMYRLEGEHAEAAASAMERLGLLEQRGTVGEA